ncbi:MAG: bifunctional diaminohydroxyphosphoribosylaminopyrimidine deaminase/5-amino-6-(5-phosphoribosylamino)uracil reductase RibD [bacterium]|nr:bifunctional diaminohydroxyphosphoribosylaminopyrimidine deaminase/5-amino-6-(5-phosphoribosylamino)uracil reductase RibD [bacterium]
MSHNTFIHHCLKLAEKGRGVVGINPMVGAVLVHGDQVLAEGWHAGYGKPHAELALLQNNKHIVSTDDVLYINLEPCCHHGKTPPCTGAIIANGIRTVVFGMYDPNSFVAGRGIATLRAAGIHVLGPVLPELCRRLNRGFVSLHEQGRPFITLKKARTKDGRTSGKITTPEQDEWSHQWLRGKHDAILVGVDTVIADDPSLTIRTQDQGLKDQGRQPLRIVLDPKGRMPSDAKLALELADGTMVITKKDIPYRDGQFNLQKLLKFLSTPTDDFHGIASILVEGGQRTWESFRNAGFVDEEVVLSR